ncbi:MAG: bifunctional diguanylate cyclase/phosphodiesterase [Clostridiales bacterium]|nr:bifunctional diguanylate cyclase/phosphodiesterase [Clostridiales bacterium]
MTAVVVLCAVVVLITGLIGVVLSSQSSGALRTLINERMLDISNTAADMLDGDALAGLTEEDVDEPAYREGMRILRTFYDNIELEFIYCIYDRGNGLYVFGIDPSDDPGAFEDPVVTTPALVAAFGGVSGVDREAYEDAWGIFYSSYSPVFTSDGKVACVVAVDFDANWYNDRLTKQLWIVLIAVFLTLAAGIGMTLMISSRLRSRLRRVSQEAVELGNDVEQLARAIRLEGDEDPGTDPENRSSQDRDIEAIRERLQKTQGRLKEYILYTNAQAKRDLMTGAGSRNAYLEKMDHLNRQIADGKASFAIGIFDLNNLKQINDLCGHETGDRIIIQASDALTEVFGRESVFRIGGDEFVAVMENAGREQVARLGAQLQETILRMNRRPVHPEAELSVSKGFAVFDPHSDADYLALFRRADQDMYSDKESFYRSEGIRRKLADASSSEARNRARKQHIADHLEEAIAKGQIRAWIQPIVRLVNNRVCAEEALARWSDPERGMISPAEFIPALEEARLAYKLDLHMVEEVANFLRMKAEDGIPLVPVSVNLSRTDFDACDMVEEIAKRVDRAGVDRGLLRLEITESMIGSDFDFMRRQIERFGEKGFKVWMDDFGSGFSSLDVLQSLPFDTIKLDMRFMREYDGSDRSRVILTELVSMALGLGINTIVEGVEREDQVRFLAEIGAGKVQGYFYSAPVSQDELRERRETGYRIGLENPGETEYYNSISKINLRDPSMVAKTEGVGPDYSGYFRTLPMAVMEADAHSAVIIRANRSYREFVARHIGFSLEENPQNAMLLDDPAQMSPFVEAVIHRRDEGGWETLQESLPNGDTIHAFIRHLASNPVTGRTALAVVVLTVM